MHFDLKNVFVKTEVLNPGDEGFDYLETSILLDDGRGFRLCYPSCKNSGITAFRQSNDSTIHDINGAQKMKPDSVKNSGREIFSVRFSGFINHDVFYDTRQTVHAREALVVLYPQNVRLDAVGKDINARDSFNMLNIHSRLGCSLSGPDFLGARIGALVEADFFGNENKNFSDLNGLRLFNAYVKIEWRKTKLLAGQYWHPLSAPGFFPNVVSFGAGAPFHSMSRNPQISISHSLGKLKVAGSLLTQRDFTGTGPDGPGSQYLRNSGIPNIHLQVQYHYDSSAVSGGIGFDYKKTVPELFTSNGLGELFATRSSLASLSVTGFAALKTKPVSVKMQGVYAQNPHDHLMIGGYAESRIADARTGTKIFTNLNTVTFWADIQSDWSKINFGIFCGYTENLGSVNTIEGPVYARGPDIKKVARIAPRFTYATGNLKISLEAGRTAAHYGTPNGNGKGKVTDTRQVINFRPLLSLKYSF